MGPLGNETEIRLQLPGGREITATRGEDDDNAIYAACNGDLAVSVLIDACKSD